MRRALLLAFSLCVACFGFSAAGLANPQGKKVALLATGSTHPFIAAVTKAFLEKANSAGIEVTTFNTPFDAALQSQQVDDAIARKFDLIAIILRRRAGYRCLH